MAIKSKNWLKRLVLPIGVLVLWLAAAAIGGPYFGKIDQVSSNDLATFLPTNAESTVVKQKIESFVDTSSIPGIIVFESDSPLGQPQFDKIDRVREALAGDESVVEPPARAIMSEDGKAAIVVLAIDSNTEFSESIPRLQQIVKDNDPAVNYAFTGPAMFSRDLNKAFSGIDGTLLFVALGVVFVILLIVYRSPILPIITLIGAMIALSAAILLVWHLAKQDIVQLNGQVQGILFILVIGAATDYSLLYIARYREELIHYRSVLQATKAAWKASFEPIVAAGGTVSLGLLCLLASDLASNKALGPVGAIGVGFAVLATLTFLPAALLLFGRAAFWPKWPRYGSVASSDYRKTHPVWARVGNFVGKHPRRIWVATTAMLLLACLAIPQFKSDGVSQENLIIGKSEARDGQTMLNRHFASGSGAPAYLVVPIQKQQEVVKVLEADQGVDAVSVLASDERDTQIPTGRSQQKILEAIRQTIDDKRNQQINDLEQNIRTQLAGAPDETVQAAIDQAKTAIPSTDDLLASANPFSSLKPKQIDGNVLMAATLKNTASSLEARQTVKRLRQSVVSVDPSIKIGGVSAIQLDTNTASNHDIKVVMPLILLCITIVLMLLLRAVVAPIVLLLTTVLSFGATLGIGALLFNHVWHFAGADPSVVIFGFVFLVALGIDYNIFLMTRVREETIKLGVRKGTLKALVVTGGVITSAGIVLAATFASLYVIPILFLVQIAFIVAFGVLLDTLIVRSLLVPALTLEIAKKMWWPSKLSKKGD